MDALQVFQKVMQETDDIALATSTGNTPNVRIMNFYAPEGKKGLVYISTFQGTPKTAEFLENKQVAFTTVVTDNPQYVRVKGGTVQKSALTIDDIADVLQKKYPTFHEVLEVGKDKLEVYEIHFSRAEVNVAFNQKETVTL